MSKRKLIASDEAVEATCQHTSPCSDCPWARDALPGWLGANTPEEWLQFAHRDVVIPCHVLNGAQCAGAAIYRANVLKIPVEPNLQLPKDKGKVFATPNEFLQHHTGKKK